MADTDLLKPTYSRDLRLIGPSTASGCIASGTSANAGSAPRR